MNKIIGLIFFTLISLSSLAQTDSTKAEDFNFDEFGNADEKIVKTYCTQKVNYLSPTRFVSVGFESVLPFHITSGNMQQTASNPGNAETHVNRFSGLRAAFNTPVISRSNMIISLGLTYWNTGIRYENPERSNFFKNIETLNSTGINTTIFKPFNNKNFLIIQASADLNGNYKKISELNSKGLTYSGVAIYGWKKDDNLMWGLGVSRTYRAGQVIHVPAILYNKTFNKNWGIEAVLPAKANLRRNFSPSSFLMLGYEIEGNTFYVGQINNKETHLRRGEMKPRISFERQIKGFIWLAAQAGWRYNWRYDGFLTQNPAKNEMPTFTNTLGNPLYFNLSLNFVSP